MAYLHIDNLYKNQTVLAFKEVYALEKIHGTSAHICYRQAEGPPMTGICTFFSGGAPHDAFVKLFDEAALSRTLDEMFPPDGKPLEVYVYGEAYGGRMQGMKKISAATLILP